MKTATPKRIYLCLTIAFLLALASTPSLTVQSAEAKSRGGKPAAPAVVEETEPTATAGDASSSYVQSAPEENAQPSASEQPKETDPYKTATQGQVGISLFNVLFNALTIYLCIVVGVLFLGFGGVFLGAVVWHCGKAFRGGRPPVIG